MERIEQFEGRMDPRQGPIKGKGLSEPEVRVHVYEGSLPSVLVSRTLLSCFSERVLFSLSKPSKSSNR